MDIPRVGDWHAAGIPFGPVVCLGACGWDDGRLAWVEGEQEPRLALAARGRAAPPGGSSWPQRARRYRRRTDSPDRTRAAAQARHGSWSSTRAGWPAAARRPDLPGPADPGHHSPQPAWPDQPGAAPGASPAPAETIATSQVTEPPRRCDRYTGLERRKSFYRLLRNDRILKALSAVAGCWAARRQRRSREQVTPGRRGTNVRLALTKDGQSRVLRRPKRACSAALAGLVSPLPKLIVRVRFPSPAPVRNPRSGV